MPNCLPPCRNSFLHPPLSAAAVPLPCHKLHPGQTAPSALPLARHCSGYASLGIYPTQNTLLVRSGLGWAWVEEPALSRRHHRNRSDRYGFLNLGIWIPTCLTSLCLVAPSQAYGDGVPIGVLKYNILFHDMDFSLPLKC